MSTKTRFEKKAKGNSEMVYSFTMKSFESFDNAIPLYRVLSTDE